MHPLVRGLSAELPAPGGDDGRTRRVGGPFQINRWAIRFLPLIEKLSRKHKREVGRSWRMDETYIKVKGVWKYVVVK